MNLIMRINRRIHLDENMNKTAPCMAVAGRQGFFYTMLFPQTCVTTTLVSLGPGVPALVARGQSE
jgi:hypothetical protein